MVLGFACRVVDGHPVVVGVRLERVGADMAAEVVVDHRPVRHATWPDKLSLVAGEVTSLVLRDPPAALVVKTIEHRTPVGAPKLDDASRMRLHVEGVLLVTAQPHVPVVAVLTGQELGRLTATDKASVEAEAAALLGRKREVVEAGAAAIGALALAEMRDRGVLDEGERE